MKAEGKREREMKAILCGWYVKGKRRVGKEVEKWKCCWFICSLSKASLSICSAWSRAGCWGCKDKQDRFCLQYHLLSRDLIWRLQEHCPGGLCPLSVFDA